MERLEISRKSRHGLCFADSNYRLTVVTLLDRLWLDALTPEATTTHNTRRLLFSYLLFN